MAGDADAALRVHVGRANRILAAKGVLDAFGHVSARSTEDPGRFLLSRNLAPALVTPDDVLTLDLEGRSDDGRPSYLERFIHAAVYAARPDVGAVVHSHAPTVLPFSISEDVGLTAVAHIGGFLAGGVPVFEIRDVLGDGSDLLIRDMDLGRALAATLGDAAVVLLRGHGFVTVAPTVEVAVFQAVYTEGNARIQLAAHGLGAYVPLTEAEGRSVSAANATQVGRAWRVWLQEAGLEESAQAR